MKKKVSVKIWMVVILLAGGTAVTAQSARPKQALRDLEKRQESLFKDFERDVRDGKAQSWEWDDRAAVIRLQAKELASSYKTADWDDDDLLALAEIRVIAENYTLAAETYRAVIANDNKNREIDGLDIRARLAESLIKSDQLDAAQAVMAELKKEKAQERQVMVALVGLYKELAMALRDHGLLIRAADAAYDGYELADINKLSRIRSSQVAENLLRDQFTMAACYVALNEKMNRSKTAVDFDREVRRFDISGQTYLLDHYENELSNARLIGSDAPELKSGESLGGRAPALTDLRGKVVLLDFTAMWCVPCAATFSHWRDFQARYADRGFEIIGVTRLYGRTPNGVASSTTDELDALREYQKANNLTYPFIVGSIDDISNEEHFGVDSIPTAIFIDRKGRIRHIKRGIGDYSKLERIIKSLIDEQ